MTASSAVYNPPADLTQGYHVVAASAADSAGNRTATLARFFIDSIAPPRGSWLMGKTAEPEAWS